MVVARCRRLLAIAALAGVLGACTGEPAQEQAATVAPSPTAVAAAPEGEPEPPPARESEPAGEPPVPCDARGEREFVTTAVNFGYEPASIADVCSGDTVALTVDQGSHSFTVVGAEGDTGVLSGGSGSTTVVGEPGTYQFRCTLHPNQMSGEITIIG